MGCTATKPIFVGIFSDATFNMTWRRPAVPPTGDNLIELTALVTSSFVANNSVSVSELSTVIATVHGALLALTSAHEDKTARVPAVPPEESVTRDYIVCLEDGRRLKTLKRYLRQKYALTPDEYRKRWRLPDDYPMVAPSYSERRSSLAKRNAKHSAFL